MVFKTDHLPAQRAGCRKAQMQYQKDKHARLVQIRTDRKRIQEAIEYIKEMQNSDLIFTHICEKELLEILGEKDV